MKFQYIFISLLWIVASIQSQTNQATSNYSDAHKISKNNNHFGQEIEFTSSNLPIIIIDTNGQDIPDEPKIRAHMGIIYKTDHIRNFISDPFNDYDGMIGIETRGSSAQTFPKKSYAVETRNTLAENLNISLLGFPPENDWILYGPYSDKSLIRNILVFILANDIGRYASRTKCCELVLNGDYQGVYVLMEKIKRDKNRVNITKIQPTDVAGDAVTGGYIIKIDKPAGAKLNGWESPFLPYPGAWQRIFYQYHYPDQDVIAPEQKAYIQNFIHSFESLMNNPNYANPQNGYSKYIDVDSFVDFFILSEIAKNVDAYRLSTFFYKDQDSKNGKLFIGPLWDFNLAFGNADYYGCGFISGWQVDFQQKDDFWQSPFWWKKLIVDTNFVNKIAKRWFDLRINIFTVQRIYSIIDSLVNHIDEAQKRNFYRWHILSEYVWPNAFIGGSYPAEIRYLKQWIQSRILWMDIKMPGQSLTVIGENPAIQPNNFILEQNYPNPFNATTTIQYSLPFDTHVIVKIYDLNGKEIKLLYNEDQTTGFKSINWDGKNNHGQKVCSGVYLYKLQTDNGTLSRKLLLVR
jgi:hypothetical protein